MTIEEATFQLVRDNNKLLKENNAILKAIYQKLIANEANDFPTNVVANLVASMIEKK